MKHRVFFDPISFADNGSARHRADVTQFISGPRFFDRSIQSAAKNNANTATNTASNFGAQAAGIGSSLIPGLERDANNPQGFTPTQKNDMLVSGAESVGGANSGITGQANLTAARTRNAGGFANALDEAARIKGRQLSSNALNVSGQDARAALAKQAQARGELSGLYGTDVSAALKAMGLSDEDLKTALEAGKSGWLQQGEGLLNTLSGAAATGAKIAGG